ncbi:hypothetical protein [Microbacterium binotii]|uniref:hypothetical protein n=1 Tax=Microbacterium binotii TaxID=462710 RepID=UPI001F2296FE|nr:hypothetical protein [Microbacterium binotii]UIN31288.1 hypothetical protein LXM64_03530 [Microbacterium binotii]
MIGVAAAARFDTSDEDEWASVVDAASMRQLLRLESDETFNRRIRDAELLPPIEFPSLKVNGAAHTSRSRGQIRYWRLKDALVNLCIEQLRAAGYRDVSVTRRLAISAVELSQLHGASTQLLLWMGGRPRRRAARQTSGSYAQLALVDSERLVDVHSAAPDPVLAGLSNFELGVAADYAVPMADSLQAALELSVERNLSAIRRDPKLLRANYSGWTHYANARPDRRPSAL